VGLLARPHAAAIIAKLAAALAVVQKDRRPQRSPPRRRSAKMSRRIAPSWQGMKKWGRGEDPASGAVKVNAIHRSAMSLRSLSRVQATACIHPMSRAKKESRDKDLAPSFPPLLGTGRGCGKFPEYAAPPSPALPARGGSSERVRDEMLRSVVSE